MSANDIARYEEEIRRLKEDLIRLDTQLEEEVIGNEERLARQESIIKERDDQIALLQKRLTSFASSSTDLNNSQEQQEEIVRLKSMILEQEAQLNTLILERDNLTSAVQLLQKSTTSSALTLLTLNEITRHGG